MSKTKLIEQAQVMAAKDAEIERDSIKSEIERLKSKLFASDALADGADKAAMDLRAEVERLNELDKRRCEEIQRLRASGAQSLNDWQNIRAENERLRKALGECLDEFAHRAFDSPQASRRGNAEMVKVCGSALGEAGKKEPETCVWTVNVTENSWILGCDESKDTSAPPKVCPYCKKRVEVRG